VDTHIVHGTGYGADIFGNLGFHKDNTDIFKSYPGRHVFHHWSGDVHTIGIGGSLSSTVSIED